MELYEPLWSSDILAEVERNLINKFDVPPDKAARRIHRMRSAFPNAAVEGYGDLIAAMPTHPKDRHVAAAAVRGGAALIVTANLRDFPPDSLDRYDIAAIHPDDFLRDQLDLSPEATITCLRRQRAAYTRPQFTFTEFYLGLSRTVPDFVGLAAVAESEQFRDASAPLPLEVVTEAEAQHAVFPDSPPDPTSPLGAASLWWTALLDKDEYLTDLHDLTYHPAAWGDYEWALLMLRGSGMMQFVDRCPNADDIAYVKFMPNVDHTMRAFDEAPLERVFVLTLVRCPDEFWRAWGLSENYFPRAEEVHG